jgi:YidC/Oxa1 family membrane protein insertase
MTVPPPSAQAVVSAQQSLSTSPTLSGPVSLAPASSRSPEKEIIVEGKTFRTVFSSYGAGIKSWQIKEKNKTVELVTPDAGLNFSTFPELNFSVSENTDKKVVFAADVPSGWRITKTYELADSHLNSLTIDAKPTVKTPKQAAIEMSWGPIGSDSKDKDEKKRVMALTSIDTDKASFDTLNAGTYKFGSYNWVALDNRYFLFAAIPDASLTFDSVSVIRQDNKTPATLLFSKKLSNGEELVKLKFYAGPKNYSYLKSFKIGLGQTVDFGWFGFLGKAALEVLNFFHKLTHNYGWAIVLLTVCLQLLVFPLTVKSFKAQADMKRLQPHIKEIQTKFKNDPKRLNLEMLNIYKTHKVNPLGGCLPMVLQLPIFWALFTTLRNAYELRGAEWMFWIRDLSLADPFYILPVVMGLGMLVQQKMVAVSTDPTQAKMMMLMPVVFTFMFLKFPAGLVLYWITNSLMTMLEQYLFLRKQGATA